MLEGPRDMLAEQHTRQQPEKIYMKLTGLKDAVHILLTSDTSLTSPTRPNLSMSIASSPSFSLTRHRTAPY